METEPRVEALDRLLRLLVQVEVSELDRRGRSAMLADRPADAPMSEVKAALRREAKQARLRGDVAKAARIEEALDAR